MPFTAFTGRPKAEHVTARLIVRRVRRLNPAHIPPGQGELFPGHRHHAVFTDSPLPLVDAETAHRQHAIIEQVIADLKNGPLAHLPSGRFSANAAWLVLAAVAFNMMRAAASLAGAGHARATTATIRAQLIHVAARLGPTPGCACSTPPPDRRRRPDRPPPQGQTGAPSGRAEQIGRRLTSRRHNQDHNERITDTAASPGGSRLRQRPARRGRRGCRGAG